MQGDQRDFHNWLIVKNVGATEVPAYAAVQVSGYESSTGAVEVKRPTKDDMDPAVVFLVGAVPIGTGGYGQAQFDNVGLAYLSGSPAVGDRLGTAQDQYYLTTGGTGFTAWSPVSGTGATAAGLVARGGGGLVGVVCGTGASAGSIIETWLSTS